MSCGIDTRRVAFCGTENISTPNNTFRNRQMIKVSLSLGPGDCVNELIGCLIPTAGARLADPVRAFHFLGCTIPYRTAIRLAYCPEHPT